MMNRNQWQTCYQLMLTIRYFEERVERLFARGVITGTAHAAAGQEATAVGVCRALRKKDYVTSTHRGHGHFIARGGDPALMMAELFGKATGYSRGRGGSQLMADFGLGFLGANGITGGSIPTATGVALSMKQQGLSRVTACFFGDGAANQGTFHESLNMAAIWKLPVIYVCENNQYAMSMPVGRAMAVENIADRATAYGMPGLVVDGNDLEAVWQAARAAATRARRGDGPTLLECQTYRFCGHSRGDPRRYRTRTEEADWRKRDPIRRWRRRLVREGGMTAEEDRVIRKAARRTIRDAVAYAKRSPYPDAEDLEKGVYA